MQTPGGVADAASSRSGMNRSCGLARRDRDAQIRCGFKRVVECLATSLRSNTILSSLTVTNNRTVPTGIAARLYRGAVRDAICWRIIGVDGTKLADLCAPAGSVLDGLANVPEKRRVTLDGEEATRAVIHFLRKGVSNGPAVRPLSGRTVAQDRLEITSKSPERRLGFGEASNVELFVRIWAQGIKFFVSVARADVVHPPDDE